MEINNIESFGKAMSPQEVASFLGVSVATVYSVAEEFGGIRVGDEYVFFENVFFDRLKTKLLGGQKMREITHPGDDAANTVNDLQPLEDRHGIFG